MKQQVVILLVENDESDALLIGGAFAKAGVANPHRIVKDANVAISYLKGEGPYANRKRHPLPGLILLDLKLPGIDGFEVLKWIRRQPELKNLPVVVLISPYEVWQVNRARQLGADSFLVKPQDFENVDALGAILNRQRIFDDRNSRSPEPINLQTL
jgi:CheY-like chemotaxis protein